MDKKYSDIMEAFENCRFEDSLRQIEQLLKKIDKPDAKKKNQLSANELRNIQVIRAGSQAAVGDIHLANHLLTTQFPQPLIGEDISFLFLQICSMAMDERLTAFAVHVEEKKQKQKIDINRFVLLARKFSLLSRTFLKQYMTDKKEEDALAQIYLEYMQQLDSRSLIKFSRNRVIPQNKELNLMMVTMFLNKFISTFKPVKEGQLGAEDQIRHNKLQRATADLQLKIAIHSGNSQEARKIFATWRDSTLDSSFVYLRSILQMSEQKEENQLFWVRENLQIFRNNLDLDNYQPIFDYSLEFLRGYMALNSLDFSILKQPSKIESADLYKYCEQPAGQLQNYYDSLFSEYHNNLSSPAENRKKDYYRISLKNSLLLLLEISSKADHTHATQQFLLEYKQQYGKTLTFCSELKEYLAQQKIFTADFSQKFKLVLPQWSKPQDQLIWNINMETAFPRPFSVDPFDPWQKLFVLYEKNIKQVEHLRGLEKGERYLSDKYIIIVADSVRKFTEETVDAADSFIQECFFFILDVLENAIERSPHNFDLKLRAIYFMDKLGYYEQIIQTLQTMDIKAVQFDTLGFFYLKPIINYSLMETNEATIVRMVRNYQENYRESSEYAYKALKAASFNECEQNICYHSHMDKSYNWCIVLYTLYLKNRGKPEAGFYLKEIRRRINSPEGLTLNCDFRVLDSVIDFKSDSFTGFYGLFNSPLILNNDCILKQALLDLSERKDKDQVCQHLKEVRSDWQLKDLYSFQSFQYFQRKLRYTCTDGKRHHERENLTLVQLYNLIVSLSVAIIDFLISIPEHPNPKQLLSESMSKAAEVTKFLSCQSWRTQTKLVPLARQYYVQLISAVLSQSEQFSGKSKKKVQGKAERKQACSELANGLILGVSDEIKLGNRMECLQREAPKRMRVRDEVLDRLTRMSEGELRKLYRVKI